jgi:hypothetical protein
MEWKPGEQWRWRESGRRIGVQATVIGMHLGIFWLIQQPTKPWRPVVSPRVDARVGLRIQLLHTSTPVMSPSTSQLTHPPQPISPARRLSVRRPTTSSEPVGTEQTDATTPHTLRWNLPSGEADQSYISNRPSDGAGFQRSVKRLPGSSMAIVPGIHMVDPRTQGVAGAVRAVQALFGVADHHCVDVATWRSLSTEELLARHISPEAVDRTAAAYHCY